MLHTHCNKYKILILHFQTDESSTESTDVRDERSSTDKCEHYSSICKSDMVIVNFAIVLEIFLI